MKKGYVYRRNKKWAVAIPDANYASGYKCIGRFEKKSHAQEYLDGRKYIIEDRHVKGNSKGNIACREAFREILEHVRTNLARETYKSYHGIIKDFMIFLNKKYSYIQWLCELRPKVFDDYKLWLRDTGYEDQHVRRHHKSATINNHLKVFKAIFYKLIAWEYLEKNPIKKVELVTVDDEKVIVTLNTPEKFALFFRRCRELRPEYYNHYFCSAKLGLRFGEMVSLKWDNVDFENKLIKIAKDEEFTPKGRTRKDRRPKERVIPMTKDIESLLQSIPRISKYVFLKGAKKISRKDKSFRRGIITIVRGTELEGMTRFHELRHTTGDILGQSHSIYDIKEFLGHSDIRTTERYIRVPDERKRSMAKTLGNFGKTK